MNNMQRDKPSLDRFELAYAPWYLDRYHIGKVVGTYSIIYIDLRRVSWAAQIMWEGSQVYESFRAIKGNT